MGGEIWGIFWGFGGEIGFFFEAYLVVFLGNLWGFGGGDFGVHFWGGFGAAF